MKKYSRKSYKRVILYDRKHEINLLKKVEKAHNRGELVDEFLQHIIDDKLSPRSIKKISILLRFKSP